MKEVSAKAWSQAALILIGVLVFCVHALNYRGYLLDDAYNTCLETIEMEEAQNRLDNPGDDDGDNENEPTARPTDKPSFRPTPAPTARPTDDAEARDGDMNTSSATAHSHRVQLSFSILALAGYVIFA